MVETVAVEIVAAGRRDDVWRHVAQSIAILDGADGTLIVDIIGCVGSETGSVKCVESRYGHGGYL